ncbi:MAG: MFS transporter, partial [Lentisphaeria bacterium]
MATTTKTWQAGTLVYDRAGLAKLFFWLLFGDFAWMLSITAGPMMTPLYLKSINYSPTQMAWLMSFGSLIGMVIGPLSGVWSDRTRSRWGRRRPFLLVTTPLGALGMLYPFLTAPWALNLVVALCSVFGSFTVILFYLYNDIIPGELMGRFVGALRLVGFLGALAFQYFMFPHFDQHPQAVWVLVSCASLAGTMVMLLMVREGDYPPPAPRRPFLDGVTLFVKDGLSTPFMWFLWLTLGMTALGGPAANFFILFFSKNLGMTTTDIGRMTACGTVLAMVIAYPSGWLIDKLGVRRVWAASGLLVSLAQLALYLFARDKTSCFILYMAYNGINMVMAACLLPMIFSYLPKEKFGQLASCQGLVSQALGFAGTMTVGGLMTWTDSYRTAFLYG